MSKVIDLFSGSAGLTMSLYDAYSGIIDEVAITNIINDCFIETPVYSLAKKFSSTQAEEQYARHLADIDLLELFCLFFIRNHRNYKYSSGRSDTADIIVFVLEQNGIYVSKDKYNSWRRTKGYRLIDDLTLSRLLELLEITPDNFKRHIFSHIVLQRKLTTKDCTDDNCFLHFLTLEANQIHLIILSIYARPPCVFCFILNFRCFYIQIVRHRVTI